ncbi:MAG TPA: winged helix DNA-binding domain-containing protein [Propionibacteriaceae bacterium]|nr:winged helix DNA-binding domain-containing protein [Propionibacteriaceae bacterium]
MTRSRNLALLRLVGHRLVGADLPDPLRVVEHLGAVQAQDLPGALTSVALRSLDRSYAAVVESLNRGAIVRSWPMRGTLHLVPAKDLRWLLALTGPRMIAAAAQRRRNLSITDETIDRARDAALAALADGAALRRSDLFALWERAGALTHPQAGGHLLGRLCQEATLVLGPMADGEQLVVDYTTWIPKSRPLDTAEALAELARRYLRSHGPATTADFSRWASITMGQARDAFASVEHEFARYRAADADHLMDPELPSRLSEQRSQARKLLVLPGFDEFMLGYGDRSFAVEPAHLQRIVPGNNGMFRGTIVRDGEVIGVWKRVGSKTRPRFEAEPFSSWGPPEEASAQAAFEALPRP